MAQQTAVEWLASKLSITFQTMYDEEIKQAKAMEKEQIMKAFSDGQETPINNPTLPHYSRDEYYNDNYKK
jgi:hypothetical protein